MTWLLEMLFDSVRTMCAQFIVDAVDSINGVFVDLMSCDLSLFESLFGVAGDLYRNAILPMGIALLLLICMWQLFKTMFGRVGTNAEDPVELVGRSLLCLFLVVYAKPVVDYILDFAGTPYGWITSGGITVASFSGFVSAAEAAASILGIDRISIQLLLLIMQFVVAWNYFKILFAVAERYVLLGVFTYIAPLAFATGGSKATNSILSGWAKVFGGQVVLILLDAWGLRLFLSAYGNLMTGGFGFTRFFVCCLMLVGFCKIMMKLDSYLASLGLNLGRTNPGMSGTALALMAGRMLGRGALQGAGGNPPYGRNPGGIPERSREENGGGEGMYDENMETIPMGGRETDSVPAAEENTQAAAEWAESMRPDTGRQPYTDGQESSGAAEDSREPAQKIPGRERDGDHDTGQETDAGTEGGYDEEIWKDLQEESACMDAAGDGTAQEMEDSRTGMGDPDFVSGDAAPEEGMLPEGCEPYLNDNGSNSGWQEMTGQGDTPEEGTTGTEGAAQEGGIPGADEPDSGKMSADGGMHENGNTPDTGNPYGAWDAAGQSSMARPANAAESRDMSGAGGQAGGGDMEGPYADDAATGGYRGNHTMPYSGNGPHNRNGNAAADGRLPGCFARNGMLYMPVEGYEEPGIPYRMEAVGGQQYYAVPREAASGGMRATLQEDGSILYEAFEGGWEPQIKAGKDWKGDSDGK